MGIQALVPFIPLKAKPFFFPVSRKLVIEALVLTESWIKGYSLRFINSFSGPKTSYAEVPVLLKLKLPQEMTDSLFQRSIL